MRTHVSILTVYVDLSELELVGGKKRHDNSINVT